VAQQIRNSTRLSNDLKVNRRATGKIHRDYMTYQPAMRTLLTFGRITTRCFQEAAQRSKAETDQ